MFGGDYHCTGLFSIPSSDCPEIAVGLAVAVRAFAASLFNRDVAERVRSTLEDIKRHGVETSDSPRRIESAAPARVVEKIVEKEVSPVRSDAVTLMSLLQREARLVDLIQEDLTHFSDAQIGAAARPALESTRKTLQRVMPVRALDDSGEGSEVTAPVDRPARYRWIGATAGGQSATGKLVHQGWIAEKIDLPKFAGDSGDALVVAAAEVQSAATS